MRLLILAAFLPSVALAAGKPIVKEPVATPQQQSQSQSQSQSQQVAAEAAAKGQATSGDNYLGTSYQSRTTALAFGTTAPIPAAPSECWFPKRKLGRGQSWLWGAAQLSAVLERDERCVEDLREQRQYELERLRLEAQLERARFERITAERLRTAEIAK